MLTLVDLRERVRRHWEPSALLTMHARDAIAAGMNPQDAVLFQEIGLPEWCAPNVWLHEPQPFGVDRLLLGEDRSDRPITYDKATRSVRVEEGGSMGLHVAHDLASFLASLLDYADMVEGALESAGRDAVTANAIPAPLIAQFERKVSETCPFPVGAPWFWGEEIARLRSGRLA